MTRGIVPVTIKDIARIAGVSHTTVSRALKNNPAISPETRRRIQQLAQEMGYIPSAVAQSLHAQRTLTVGMVITTIADPFIVEVVAGVEQAAQAAGYSVFLTTSHNNPEQEVSVVETLQRRRVDAIIVTSSRVGSLYSSRLDRVEVPIVLINNQEEGEYLYSVAVDDIQGAQLAGEHLIELGHKQIGYIGAANRPRSNRRRLTGYQLALEQVGLTADPDLIFLSPESDDFERGRLSLSYFLQREVTGVFCYNDMIAIGLLTACREAGLTVPDHLSVVGFDDIESAGYVTPPLTTVRQPRFQLGRLAMEMTLQLLADQEAHDQSLACQLVVRQSTATYRQRVN